MSLLGDAVPTVLGNQRESMSAEVLGNHRIGKSRLLSRRVFKISGSDFCSVCGKTISANKSMCLACSQENTAW